MKENQNNVRPLHPLGAGIKQLPDIPPPTTDQLGKLLTTLGRGSKGTAAPPPQSPSSSSLKPSEIPDIPQHELSQTTDQLGKVPTTLGRGSKGSAAPPPQIPSSSLSNHSENFVENKPRTPLTSGISSSVKSSSSKPTVTPLSHICKRSWNCDLCR